MAFVSFLLIVTISPFVDFDIYTFNMKQKKPALLQAFLCQFHMPSLSFWGI